jgi:hypothetical protein
LTVDGLDIAAVDLGTVPPAGDHERDIEQM